MNKTETVILTVTISKKEYDALQRDSLKLNALENAGVDNWDWYSEAMEEFQKMIGEEND